VPLAILALYLTFGSPALPSRPHAERARAPEKATVAELVAQVEERLRAHPEDKQGWDVIAPVYLGLERYSDAADAFARAIRLLGETPKRLIGFGETPKRLTVAEASILASNGIVTEAARHACERVVALEPASGPAHFWLALAKEQDGNLEAAAADYRALLADSPADAAWRSVVEARIAAIDRRLGREPKVDGGGSASATAAAMSGEERQAFVEQMVAGLAERLKKDGKDLQGWLRLARSYSALGRKSEASAALAEARTNFADDAKSLGEIEALAKSLGLGS
jgi:cytochrome c-type biogenesis protein CcmH